MLSLRVFMYVFVYIYFSLGVKVSVLVACHGMLLIDILQTFMRLL